MDTLVFVVFNDGMDAVTASTKFVMHHPNTYIALPGGQRTVLTKNVNELGFEFQHLFTAEFMTLMTWDSDAIDQESVEGFTDAYLRRLDGSATWIP